MGASGTKTGYDIVYCNIEKGAKREPVAAMMGHDIVCMKEVVYLI